MDRQISPQPSDPTRQDKQRELLVLVLITLFVSVDILLSHDVS